jgi:hypothetical protein
MNASDREHVTLLVDRRRAEPYRVFVGAPASPRYRPLKKGWTKLDLLLDHLVLMMSVPAKLAADKIVELERTGGPVSFDYFRN